MPDTGLTVLPSPADLPVVTVMPRAAGNSLLDTGMTELLPASVGRDEAVQALAVAVENETRRFSDQIAETLLFASLDDMEEPLLTHMATLLHTDIWNEAWPVATKRDFLRRQIPLHRKKGTAWAVEEAVRLVYGDATLTEWFQYEGRPGTFKMDIDTGTTGMTEQAHDLIYMMIDKYKRKSQHLDSLTLHTRTRADMRIGAANLTNQSVHVYPKPVTNVVQVSPMRIGAAPHSSSTMAVFPKATRDLVQVTPMTVGAAPHSQQTMAVFPKATRDLVQVTPMTVGAAPHSQQTMAVFPRATRDLVQVMPMSVGAAPQICAGMTVLPRRETELIQVLPMAVGGAVHTVQTVSVYPRREEAESPPLPEDSLSPRTATQHMRTTDAPLPPPGAAPVYPSA